MAARNNYLLPMTLLAQTCIHRLRRRVTISTAATRPTRTDAVIAPQLASGSRPPDSRYDVSGDGSVTSLDALMILQAAAGSIEIG